MEVKELVAGRELDALVAEKVMGWNVIETDDCNGTDNFWLSKDGQHVYHGKFGDDFALPHYSTDISSAWQVVKKLVELGYWVLISNEKEEWSVELADADYIHGKQKVHKLQALEVIADTAPLAICRAALKAVGHD